LGLQIYAPFFITQGIFSKTLIYAVKNWKRVN
jgi:hypothetical protein